MSIPGGFRWPVSVPYWPLLERMSYYTGVKARVNMSKAEILGAKFPLSEIC